MMWFTHMAFGLLFGLISLDFVSPPSAVFFVAIAILASLLPDIDHENSKINFFLKLTRIFAYFFRHRGLFHSIFPPAFFLLIFKFLDIGWIGTAIAVGYVSHLVADGLTPAGVNLLYPASNLSLHGFIKTGSVGEYFVLGGVLMLCGLLVI